MGKPIDFAKVDAMMKADKARMEELIKNPPRDSWKDQEGFNVVSLKDWLVLCYGAGVPYVEAELVCEVPIEALMRYDEKPTPDELVEMVEAMKRVERPQTMFRWDCCSSEDVKYKMSKGEPDWDESVQRLMLDDPRAGDIIYEFPGHDMAVWQRPWVEAACLDGYPVEYRVFVQGGEIVGVSNYYPQRPLPGDISILTDIRAVVDMTQRLVAAMEPPVKFPGWGFQRWGADSISFTADYMALEGGQVLFLEGGPPYGCGAHPCCFPVDMKEWGKEPLKIGLGNIPVVLENRQAGEDEE